MAPVGTADHLRDWFLQAIEVDGSVASSLDTVLGDLQAKAAFVTALKQAMAPLKPGGSDAITDLAGQIKALENTLRFRLGILRAERPAAWFRTPVMTSSGPFSSTLLDQAVFAPYAENDVLKVKAQLEWLWQNRQADMWPFTDQSPCLWRTLLQLNADLARIARLTAPYSEFSLETLPDGLPMILDSRALRAFLLNVRHEIIAARERLQLCHAELRKKSEELWLAQANNVQATSSKPRGRTQVHADSVRDEMRRRREQRLRPLLSPAEQKAMAVLGFSEPPTSEDLRRRYLELAKKLHPDRSGGSDGPFKELASAYNQLMARLDGPSQA